MTPTHLAETIERLEIKLDQLTKRLESLEVKILTQGKTSFFSHDH